MRENVEEREWRGERMLKRDRRERGDKIKKRKG